MRLFKLRNTLGLAGALFFVVSVAYGATISGTVSGPDGAPFRASFVQARNAKTRITVMVLSDNNGHYRIENLPAGDYQVQARSIGYRSDSRSGIVLSANQNASFDWTLQKQMARWDEIPIAQGFKLMPDGPGKARFEQTCGASCHGFQQFIQVTRDEEGWRAAIRDMRGRISGGVINQIKDQKDADELASFLAKNFGLGPNALPASPESMPGYKDSTWHFTDDALKIVYVMYEMPPGRMTWDANPDKEGNIWLPYFGTVNGVGKLNPDTGEVQEFLWESQNPRVGTRSAYVAQDGTAWIVEEGGTLVKLDQKTGKMTKFKGPAEKGGMNTVRVDPKGILWVSGNPTSYRFDPRTEKYTQLAEVPNTYGANLDKQGNIWFDEASGLGRIFKVDYKTEKVTSWTPPPAEGSRRRLQVDSKGNVWLAQYTAGQMVKLDTETGQFKVYRLPGDDPTPYPVGLDGNENVWYASGIMDTVGRLDPSTGKITEYPPPAVGNGMRELNNDPKGRMWFASPGNNTVGYLYLAK